MADKSYTVAVQYDDTTDIMPVEYSELEEAVWMRNKIADEAIHTQGAWEGLQYVYVIANGRVMV